MHRHTCAQSWSHADVLARSGVCTLQMSHATVVACRGFCILRMSCTDVVAPLGMFESKTKKNKAAITVKYARYDTSQKKALCYLKSS